MSERLGGSPYDVRRHWLRWSRPQLLQCVVQRTQTRRDGVDRVQHGGDVAATQPRVAAMPNV